MLRELSDKIDSIFEAIKDEEAANDAAYDTARADIKLLGKILCNVESLLMATAQYLGVPAELIEDVAKARKEQAAAKVVKLHEQRNGLPQG